MTIVEWFNHYWEKRSKYERLGQAFCNDYIRHSWPELYYCTDVCKCQTIIENWLYEYQYYKDMPNKEE